MSNPNRPYSRPINVGDVVKHRVEKTKKRGGKSIMIASIMVLIFVTLIVIGGIAVFKSVGNRQWFDMTNTFNRAVITMPNGTVVDGHIDSWRDYDGSDQIQVRMGDTTYLTHITNVVLIAE